MHDPSGGRGMAAERISSYLTAWAFRLRYNCGARFRDFGRRFMKLKAAALMAASTLSFASGARAMSFSTSSLMFPATPIGQTFLDMTKVTATTSLPTNLTSITWTVGTATNFQANQVAGCNTVANTCSLQLRFIPQTGSTGPVMAALPIMAMGVTTRGDNLHDAGMIGLSGMALAPSETPLPSTLPLFISGLGAVGLLARGRKKKAKTTAAT